MDALRAKAVTVLTMLALATPALGQTAASAPNPDVAPDLRAAMDKADAGTPADLVALADSGRADAQYYAGVMYLSGRGVPADLARGCGYVEKASATRADAMFLVGQCRARGVGARPDPQAAQVAFISAANLGDVRAQLKLGDAYSAGELGTKDPAVARRWYDMAAKQGSAEASRKLGSLYADGEGGDRDAKRAMELWLAAEKGGDPQAPILVADALFSQLTGGRAPGPGRYAFKGGIPVADIEVIETWYREAQARDPRPDIQERAKTALNVLAGFKKAAQ
jgi:TPR repeat protein